MDHTIALVTTDQKIQRLKMLVVSWVRTITNQRYIEISAANEDLGQLLVRITASGGEEFQERLSQFCDKLGSMMGRFDTQLTAYTGTDALAPELDIDLKTNQVYLILTP